MAGGKNYQIMDRVATGGTAVLYRAVQTSLDRVVAVKKLHHHLTTDENFTRRFILEAKAAASLDHENIVKIIDFGIEDGTYMMVMEFIEGESLKDILEKWKQLPANLALVLVHQICMGLEHAHAKGIVHRDVKPGNVMLSRTGKVKITDFGLAKLAQAQIQHTAANSILGTPLYMSPEQAFGESVDQRSDLFSLGTVLYECLTGRQPFHGESYMGVIQNIIHQNAPHPSKLGVDLSDGVETILVKAMNKNRDARFQNAREFRLAIEEHLGLDALKTATDNLKSLLATDGSTMVLPRTERARKKSRRLRRTAVAAFTVAAVSGIAVALYFLMPDALRGRITNGVRSAKNEPPVTQGPLFAAGMINGFEGVPLSGGGVMDHPTIPVAGVRADSAGVNADAEGQPRDAAVAYETNRGASAAAERVSDTENSPIRTTGDGSTGVQPLGEAAANGPSAAGRGRETPEVPRAASRASDGAPMTAEPAPETARIGWLSVTSEPAAEMYIDDRHVGDTPAVRIELTSGAHTLECRSPKHEPYREAVHITAGELSSRRIVLSKLEGRISLSTIEGAEVHVDGVFIGTTPLEGPVELEAGRHQLTIKKPGFHVWNNGVTIEAKQLLPLRITLSPIY